MKTARVLGILALGMTLWAADPAAGTWKLNVAKSKYSPGPAPKSATTSYEVTGDSIKRTGTSTDADGKTTSMSYTAKYDGKEYPVTGSDVYDTISVTRIDDRTSEATMKKAGKTVSTARRVVSADGKTMTITINGTNAKGEKMKNTSVYDKQ